MEYVRMRHGNAVWHVVTKHVLWGWSTELETECEPGGYCFEGPRTEVVQAEEAPGRLCVVCRRKSERERERAA